MSIIDTLSRNRDTELNWIELNRLCSALLMFLYLHAAWRNSTHNIWHAILICSDWSVVNSSPPSVALSFITDCYLSSELKVNKLNSTWWEDGSHLEIYSPTWGMNMLFEIIFWRSDSSLIASIVCSPIPPGANSSSAKSHPYQLYSHD